MNNNWYSSWTGGSNGNSSSCFNKNCNQSDGKYEYGGWNLGILNNGGNFIGNIGGFNPGFGATGNNGNIRRNYEPRYASSNYRANYSGNFRGGYEQRYRDNGSSNDRSNYRGNYEQRYGENGTSNNGANYSDNFRTGFRPSFRDHARGNQCGISYVTGNNKERYYGHERHTDSDWTGHYYSEEREDGSDGQNKDEESCLKKSIQDCLLEGSIVVVKQQRGRPKYQCLHCKITFFNEDHIEKKGHLRHVKHCRDVRACFEATVGKRGFGLNFIKLSSHTSEGLEFKKVKTEPYQNGHAKDYIEKDIIKESERIEQKVKKESFEKHLKNKDLRIKQDVKLEKDCTQEVTGGGFKVNHFKAMSTKEKVHNYLKNIAKDNADIQEELIIKTEMDIEQNEDIRCNLGRIKEMSSHKRVQNSVTNQIKEEAFSDINLKKEIIIKKEMTGEKCFENNEKHLKMISQDQEELISYVVNHNTKEEATIFAEKQAQEKKKELRKRKKEKKKRQMDQEKKGRKNRVKEKRKMDQEKKDHKKRMKQKKRETKQYACLKLNCLETFRVWGDARSHMQQGCLQTTMTEKGWPITIKPNLHKSRKKAEMIKGVAVENEEKLVEAANIFYAENLRQYPSPKQVVSHLLKTYQGFGIPPARVHQIVKSLSN